MLEPCRRALQALIVLVLSLPLVAVTLSAVESRDRALAEIARFGHGGPTFAFLAAQARATRRDAERRSMVAALDFEDTTP